jgi:hypothetical protein
MLSVAKYVLAIIVVGAVGVTVTAGYDKAEGKKGIAPWEYPGAKKLGGATGGPLETALYVTGDDLDKVLKHFADKLGRDLKDVTATAGGVEGTPEKQTASFNDSFRPYDDKTMKYPPRAVTMHVAVQNTKTYTLTLIISRVKDEDHTHIAVTYVEK